MFPDSSSSAPGRPPPTGNRSHRCGSVLLPALVALLMGLAACDTADHDAEERTGTEAETPGSVSERMAQESAAPVVMTSLEEALETRQAEFAFFWVPSTGFAHVGDEGEVTGVTAELLRDFAHFVADSLAIDVNVTWMEEELWADFYGYVRDSEGAAFGIGNVTITESRRDELDFSPPYLQNIAVLVTHADVPELESLEGIGDAFGDLVALRYPGTLHEERLEALRDAHAPEMEFRTIASNDELVSALSEGPETFGYIDIYNYWRATEDGAPLRRHEVGDDASEEFGIILPDGSDWTALVEAYFEAREGLLGTDAYRTLLETHLGPELAGLLSG
ncbi:MAG: amino acid ABC transporter substrate-binding protein [Gemmatimonadales bacterium]|nr:MAG: amino acid ABC transporter substrate-binding protein [Gemmatimonadales bacterium]